MYSAISVGRNAPPNCAMIQICACASPLSAHYARALSNGLSTRAARAFALAASPSLKQRGAGPAACAARCEGALRYVQAPTMRTQTGDKQIMGAGHIKLEPDSTRIHPPQFIPAPRHLAGPAGAQGAACLCY